MKISCKIDLLDLVDEPIYLNDLGKQDIERSVAGVWKSAVSSSSGFTALKTHLMTTNSQHFFGESLNQLAPSPLKYGPVVECCKLFQRDAGRSRGRKCIVTQLVRGKRFPTFRGA